MLGRGRRKCMWGKTIMYRALVLSSVLIMAGAAGAAADSAQLQGSYGFTGSASCLISRSGFNSTTLASNDPGMGNFSRSYSVEGVRTFNGDGTGTVNGTVVAITFPSANPSASGADFKFSFTYTINADGSWTSDMVPNSYSEAINYGPRTGETLQVDSIPEISGMISKDGKTLTGAHLKPTVETHTYYNSSNTLVDTEPMICQRSRVFISLPAGGSSD
jgi:hypothetical protein